MTDVMLAQLYALRAHLDAMILGRETELGMSRGEPVEPGSCPQCKAGPDQVTKNDTLDGAKQRYCRVCDHTWVPA